LWSGTEKRSLGDFELLLGAVIGPIIAGIFPVLLLFASRRRGELLPGTVYRAIGQPWLLTVINFLFLAGLILHALLFFHDPVERILAGGIGLGLMVMTVAIARSGAFSRSLAWVNPI